MIGNSECVRLVADRLNITNRFYFVFIAEFVDRLPSCLILIPLGKMINFGSFAQRNALDQWSNDPSLDHADQWSNESFSRVDLIDHWSENGFATDQKSWSGLSQRNAPLVSITARTKKIKTCIYLPRVSSDNGRVHQGVLQVG